MSFGPFLLGCDSSLYPLYPLCTTGGRQTLFGNSSPHRSDSIMLEELHVSGSACKVLTEMHEVGDGDLGGLCMK